MFQFIFIPLFQIFNEKKTSIGSFVLIACFDCLYWFLFLFESFDSKIASFYFFSLHYLLSFLNFYFSNFYHSTHCKMFNYLYFQKNVHENSFQSCRNHCVWNLWKTPKEKSEPVRILLCKSYVIFFIWLVWISFFVVRLK